MLDLLTKQEDLIDQRIRQFRFDIPLLAERLTAAIDWLQSNSTTANLPIGLFGASTGASALIAAARPPNSVRP